MNAPSLSSRYGLNTHMVLIARLLYVMILFSVCRLLFYFFNANYFPGITPQGACRLFLGGLRFDLSAVLYTNVLYILLLCLPFTFKYRRGYQKTADYIFIVTNAIALFANCADFIYYHFTIKRTTWTVLKEFSHETNLTALAGGFLFRYWYVWLIWIAMIAMLWFVTRKIRLQSRPDAKPWQIFLVQSILLYGVVELFIGGVRGGFRHSTRPITLSNAGEYVQKPKEMFIALNTPFCIYRTMGSTDYERVQYYKDATELRQHFNPVHLPDSTQAPFRKLNVVILIWESLGKELVGGYNHDLDGGRYKGYTPFIDSLMGNSQVFWYSFANGVKSIEAIPSILSGIPGIREPFITTRYTDNTLPSLPRLLGEKGYQTSFFHGAPNGSMGFQAYANLIGIQRYYGKTEYNNDQDYDGIWGIWDDKFLSYWADEMNKFPQPFMSTLFTVSSHDPFQVPEAYKGRFPKGPLPVCEPMGYTDHALQQFFEKAKKMPWYKNTLFVITADHSTVAHYPEYQTSVGNFSIPILFFSPGDTTLRGIDKQTLLQQIDIGPSILGYLHYDQPYFSFGKNVFKPGPANYAVNYDGVYQWYNGPYLLQYDGQKAVGLYNYQEDRLLKHDLKGQRPEIQPVMEAQVRAFIQQYINRMLDDKLTP